MCLGFLAPIAPSSVCRESLESLSRRPGHAFVIALQSLNRLLAARINFQDTSSNIPFIFKISLFSNIPYFQDTSSNIPFIFKISPHAIQTSHAVSNISHMQVQTYLEDTFSNIPFNFKHSHMRWRRRPALPKHISNTSETFPSGGARGGDDVQHFSNTRQTLLKYSPAVAHEVSTMSSTSQTHVKHFSNTSQRWRARL